VIGMHFFYPAHIMKLVEVIPGLDTSEETIADITTFAEGLRKLSVRVEECPGFLVNRILMPYLNEAAFCLQEGSALPKEIDQAMMEFGFPMGPFTLVDNLGFDVCQEVVKILLDAYGLRMEPAPLWDLLAGKKRLGVKSGAGFYLYGDRSGQPDKEFEEILKEAAKTTERKGAFSVNRLVTHIAERIVHPPHVPLQAESEPSQVGGTRDHRPRRRFLRDRHDIGILRIHEFIEPAEESDRFQVLPSAVLIRQPFAVFTRVVAIEHRRDGIDAKPVDMKLSKPVERVGDEKITHLVAAVVEDQGIPIGMLSLSWVLMLKQRGAVESRQAVLVLWEMRGGPVE